MAGTRSILVRVCAGAALSLLVACTGAGDVEDPTPHPSNTASETAAAVDPIESPTAPPSDTPTAAASETPPLWEDVTETAIGETSEWSNKVELADLDADGDVDLLFADGGDYETPGEPLVSQVWINDGSGVFAERGKRVLGPTKNLTRVIKVRDVNADGRPDIFVGTTYQTQSRLLLGKGGLRFEDVTATHLPKSALSVGDAEFGDVDGDGDLDLALAHWGAGTPLDNKGGRTQLWLNDGTGHFTDATGAQMPKDLVRFSWELEFVDSDGDWDLDLAVSCKRCVGSFLFVNDGHGDYSHAEGAMPAFTNNYEFEVTDLDGDGLQDLLTINDGPDFGEHVFRGVDGRYVDATSELWPEDENLGGDDNVIVVLDYDSDGDPDFLIGSLEVRDRLIINDGSGHLELHDGREFPAIGPQTRGTLGMAVADLNADNRLDVVQAQGEVPGAEDERVFFGTGIEPDSAAPLISAPEPVDGRLHVRITDNKTPLAAHDFLQVYGRGPDGKHALQWYGEALWRAPANAEGLRELCAIDRAGNQACIEV